MSRFLYGVNPVLEAIRAHPHDVVRVLVELGFMPPPPPGAPGICALGDPARISELVTLPLAAQRSMKIRARVARE